MPNKTALTIFFGLLTVVAAMPALSFESMKGCFVAAKSCPAKSSIRRNRNPGGVTLEAGRNYLLRGANKAEATHYQVRIPGANPKDRWVEKSCGRIVETCDLLSSAAPTPGTPAAPGTGPVPTGVSTNNVIAISWQPAFCQTHQHKTECKAQTTTSFEASHFTLHGLWPQPRGKAFCGVSGADKQADKSGRWHKLPALALSTAVRDRLNIVMPGTQSNLQRHEWTKHGTCYGTEPDEYFKDALGVMKAINTSAVRDLFAANIGKSLSVAKVRQAFDTAFGQGAGDRVTMSCAGSGQGRLIVELIVGLKGRIKPDVKVADLIADAKPRNAGCSSGIVDPVGF